MYNEPMNPYQASAVPAFRAEASERSKFITRTYLHLLAAILAFAGLEVILLNIPGLKEQVLGLLSVGRWSWLVVLVGFMVVSNIADSWARSPGSIGKQYLGLGLYVVAWAAMFLPLLAIATFYEQQTKEPIIMPAAVSTLALMAILTATVFLTRHDFSFLRGILMFGGLAALGFIVVAIIFGFTLGPIFTYLMIALACGYILYHTSNVLHHYHTSQYVAASLALFASVALLFWYILQLFMSRR